MTFWFADFAEYDTNSIVTNTYYFNSIYHNRISFYSHHKHICFLTKIFLFLQYIILYFFRYHFNKQILFHIIFGTKIRQKINSWWMFVYARFFLLCIIKEFSLSLNSRKRTLILFSFNGIHEMCQKVNEKTLQFFL